MKSVSYRIPSKDAAEVPVGAEHDDTMLFAVAALSGTVHKISETFPLHGFALQVGFHVLLAEHVVKSLLGVPATSGSKTLNPKTLNQNPKP